MNREGFVVHYPKFYFWAGVVCTAFFIIIFFVMLAYPNDTASFWVGATFVGFALLGVCLIVSSLVWKIQALKHEEHFVYTTWLGRTYKFRYGDIVDIKEGYNALLIKMSGSGPGKRLYIDNNAVNHDLFVALIKKKAPKEVVSKACVTVRLSQANLWAGIGCTAFFVWLFVWMMNDSNEASGKIGYGLLCWVFILFGIYGILGALVWRIHVLKDEDYFIYVSRLGRSHNIKYSDVISTKDGGDYFVIKATGKRILVEKGATDIEYLRHALARRNL